MHVSTVLCHSWIDSTYFFGELCVICYVLSCNLTQHSFLSIPNTVTHTHLNSLFGKIADLNQMGIRADKLFRLILKTDLNKQKIELYRRKLGIYQNENGAISSDSLARMVSRGPFIAIFKHESIAFVNSLENAARPLTERRRKRKKNKSTSTSGNTSQNSSVHQTIKSAPADNRQNRWSHDDARSKSPKRKKIEDRSGMIIVAQVDHDEISLVSISPTNEFQPFSSDNLVQEKPLSLIDGNYKSKSDGKKIRKDRSHSSRKSARKNKKRRSSLRSIKSIGHRSDEHDEECDSLSSRSLFSSSSPTVDTRTTASTEHESLANHERSPSNLETVDIREVLEENSTGGREGAFSFFAPSPFANQMTSMNMANNPYYHQGQLPMYGLPHAHPYSQHPQHHHGMYSHPHAPMPHANWQYDPYYQYAPSHNNGNARENVQYEECFLIKGLTSFMKKVFRIEKKQELFEPSPQRNINAYQGPAWPAHQDAACQDQQQWQFDAPPRQRTRSRVFSDNEDSLSQQMDHDVAASATTFESTFDSLHTNSQDEKEKKTDARMLVFQEEQDRGSKARNPFTTKAMEAWKASGPANEDITKPNAFDNAFDSLYTHVQIVQDGAEKERKVDANPMVFQEKQDSEGDINSQVPEALCTTKLMEIWKASGPSNADAKSSIVDDFGIGARGLNPPNTHGVLDDKKRNPMSEIKTSSNGNANIAQPRKRTTSIGGSSYSNRSRSGSGSSSSRTRSRRSSGISVFKDSSNSEKKNPLLDRPRPNSLAGQARSKSDGTRLFNNSSGSTSSSSSISSASRPSIISRSTSTGSSSSLSQNRARTISAGSAGSYFHYR